MKFSIKDFLSKYDQIQSFLRIWSHLLKKSSIENFIYCAVKASQSLNGKTDNDLEMAQHKKKKIDFLACVFCHFMGIRGHMVCIFSLRKTP